MRIAKPGGNRQERRRLQATGGAAKFNSWFTHLHLTGGASSVDEVVRQLSQFGVAVLADENPAPDLVGLTPAALGERVCIGQAIEFEGGYLLQCLRELQGTSPKERHLALYEMQIDRSAGMRMRSVSRVVHDGTKWWHCNLAEHNPILAALRSPDVGFLECLLGMQLEERYDWTADIRWGESFPIRVTTDALGAREFFALRDKPNGHGRRPALLHWVRKHWRRRRADPDALAYVKQHMRGQETFKWNGYEVVLKAPRYEMERAFALTECDRHGVAIDDIWPKTQAILQRRSIVG
jgi:hypothetical protein